MKTNNILRLFSVLLGVILLSQLQLGCSKAKTRSSYALVMSADCLFNPTACDGNVYESSSRSGFEHYEYDMDYLYNNSRHNNGYDYFCGCTLSRQVPIYHEHWGLGCASKLRLEQATRRRSYYSVLTYRYDKISETLILSRSDSQTLPGPVGKVQNRSCAKEILRSCDLTKEEFDECGPNARCTNISDTTTGNVGICMRDGY